jgi:hypothetical protein
MALEMRHRASSSERSSSLWRRAAYRRDVDPSRKEGAGVRPREEVCFRDKEPVGEVENGGRFYGASWWRLME